jgi:3-oxoacyl-[acyl-carrier protein] reductase
LQRNRSRRLRGAEQRGLAQHRAAQVPGQDDLGRTARPADEAFGRAAEPWEVAATIAFLASDYSSYLTGEVISVSSQHP